jgi:hypothetical protein
MNASQANAAARQLILARAIEMRQQIYSSTFNPAQQPTINVQPRYAGLIRKFIVKFSATIVNNDGALALALTDFGLSNFLSPQSGIVLTDLNNNQRINTGGWHLGLVNSIKHRKPYAAVSVDGANMMANYGENFPILASGHAGIGATDTATVSGYFEIPVSYDHQDLRGAIYANVVNATMQLSLTINPNPFTAAGVDSTFAMFKGTSDAVISSVTITVYQDYLYQLPVGKNGTILPLSDLATVYELKNTTLNAVPVNQDFGFQYPNFRDVLSTFSIFDHDTTTDTGRQVGQDINNWKLQSANFTNIFQLDPLTFSMPTREILRTDLPPGCYYSSSRQKPISTVQYGNIELVLNASTSTANSLWSIGLEDFSYPNTIAMAGSLQS